jgi:hypothetical protein
MNSTEDTLAASEPTEVPTITVEDRCDMCKFAMHELIPMLKTEFNITDAEFNVLQEKVAAALNATRPTEEDIANLDAKESVHVYGLNLTHYALLVYCAAGTLKNGLEFKEPIKEAATNG